MDRCNDCGHEYDDHHARFAYGDVDCNFRCGVCDCRVFVPELRDGAGVAWSEKPEDGDINF